MSELHHLILRHGQETARGMVPVGERHLVDAAAAVLAVEREEIGISYSGFALTSLPHKRIPDDQVWEKSAHRLTLTVTPGRLPSLTGGTVPVGVPYGAYARLIMLYLQTQAIKTGDRRVELGRSMRAFLERLGLSIGGKTYERVWDQARRIAACNLVFSWQRADGRADFLKDNFVTRGAFNVEFHTCSTDHARLWEDEVVLGEHFYKQLTEHPVPVLEQALRQINNNSVAIDVYIWLAYRLRTILKPTFVRWPALAAQFGSNYTRVRDFKRGFKEPLRLALAVYPDARVRIEEEGIILETSRPPILERA
jgi:Plasmid encoded RepA protein